MSFGITAGVYMYEVDRSSFVTSTATSIGACVAGLKQGPLGPKYITSTEEFLRYYGETPASWSKAPYCIKAALRQTSMFYVNRVVNGALYGGTAYFNDVDNNRTMTAPFPTGSSLDYESGSRSLSLLTLSSYLSEGQKISVGINDGENNIVTVEQEFSTSSNETLLDFATKINDELAKLGSGGNASVIKEWTSAARNQQITLTFNEQLTAENFTKISGKILPLGGVAQPYEVGFTESNDKTLQAIADAFSKIVGFNAAVVPGLTGENSNRSIQINSELAGPDNFTLQFQIEGTATASQSVTKQGHGVYDDRVIQVTFPENSQAFFADPDVTGNAAPVLSIQTDVKFLDIFAQNPGEWANNYGVKITNVDLGIASRHTITLSQALLPTNIISADLIWKGETHTVAVEFSQTSDNTLDLFAKAITEKLAPLGGFGEAFVTKVAGGYDNDRDVIVVSPNAEDDLEIEDVIVTGGTSQAICTVKKTLDAIPSSRTFTLSVYSRSDINTPIETFKCAFNKQTDSNGNQLFVEDVVNNESSGSIYIRVKTNPSAELKILQEDSVIRWMAAGDDGALPTNAQIIKGWNDFEDPEKITVRVLINGGYTNVAVQQAMDSLAQSRKDCFAILDCPSDKQSATAYVNYRKYDLNINSSYSAIYGPDLLITDDTTGEQLYVPPSGHVAAQYFYTDSVRDTWWAPAGLNRGLVLNVQGLRFQYGKGDRPILDMAQCNYIRSMSGLGYPIWSEHTLQSKSSALSDVHVRRLLITLEVSIADYLQYGLFDPNDQYTRDALVDSIRDYLTTIQRRRAFQITTEGEDGFYVVSDESNNPAEQVDQGIMVIDVAIKPIRVAKFIRLNVTIAKTSANFTELLEAA